jgi:hypothetical protein
MYCRRSTKNPQAIQWIIFGKNEDPRSNNVSNRVFRVEYGNDPHLPLPIETCAKEVMAMLDDDESAPKVSRAIRANEEEVRQLSIDEEQPKDERRLWRGIFSPPPERDSLFTVEADLRTADLPSWEPFITIIPRWYSDDDE